MANKITQAYTLFEGLGWELKDHVPNKITMVKADKMIDITASAYQYDIQIRESGNIVYEAMDKLRGIRPYIKALSVPGANAAEEIERIQAHERALDLKRDNAWRARRNLPPLTA